MLPALFGAPLGGTYRLPDPAGAASRYRIVEVEYTGIERIYGPYSAQVESAPDVRAAGFKSVARGRPAGARKARAAVKKADPGPFDRLKISVGDRGVYFVSAAETATLLGRTEAEVISMLDQAQFSLTCNGAPVAYRAADAGMYFFGDTRETIYSDQNVYVLEYGAGLHIQAASGSPAVPVPGLSFADTARFEQAVYASTAMFSNPEEDFWLWDILTTGSNTNLNKKSFTFDLTDPASAGRALLKVRLHGYTDWAQSPDHHARISVNGVLVAEGQWDGQTPIDLEAELDGESLSAAGNVLQIEAVTVGGVAGGRFLLDRFDVTYQRLYRAVNDQIILKAGSNAAVTAEGFTSNQIEVWDVSDPMRPVRLNGLTPSSSSVSFVPASADRVYAVYAAARSARPAGMRTTRLRNGASRGAHLVISAPELEGTAELLAQYRQAQGLPAMIATVEDVYNEFSYGIANPHAIPFFLKHASENWAEPPRYLVLAGAGSYDFRDYAGHGECMVPPLMTATPNGLYASDNKLADGNGDKVADVPVGRLPAQTPAELRQMLSRILSYEKGGAWKNGVHLSADNPDAGGMFPADSDELAKNIPSTRTVGKTYLDSLSVTAARAQLVGVLNDGQGIFHYLGHAGSAQLADEGILRTNELAQLTNDAMAPFAMIMSCTAGRYDVPGVDCLTETMLRSSSGGAVASWAPTTLAENDQNVILARSLFGGVFSEGDERIGDAVKRAMTAYKSSRRMEYVLESFSLLGDPATSYGSRSAVASFDEWKWWQFGIDGATNAALSDAFADPDEDGNANLMEFALDLDPNAQDEAVAVSVRSAGPLAGKYPLFTFDRRKAPRGTSYRLEVSTDIESADWLYGSGVVEEVSIESLDETMERVTVWVNDAVASGPVVYVRLKVVMEQ